MLFDPDFGFTNVFTLKNLCMKKITTLFLFVSLLACTNKIKGVKNRSEEQIFRDIFTLNVDGNNGLNQLNKLKFYEGFYNPNEKDKKNIALANSKLIESIRRNYPGFFASFNTMVRSGNPRTVQRALQEGCNIVWAIIIKDTTNNRSAVSLRPDMSETDQALLKQLNTTTDYQQALKLIDDAKQNGFFSRTLQFDRRLGLESFRLPIENNAATQFAPDVNYPYKDITPTKNFALVENVAFFRDAIVALELYIAKVLAIGTQLQVSGEPSLLQEKVINEITLKYKV